MSLVKLRDLCSHSQNQTVNYTSRIINKDFLPYPLLGFMSLPSDQLLPIIHTGFTGVMSSGLDTAETAGLKHDAGSESYGIPEFLQSKQFISSSCCNNTWIYCTFQAGVNLILCTLLPRSDSLFRGVNQCIALKDDK